MDGVGSPEEVCKIRTRLRQECFYPDRRVDVKDYFHFFAENPTCRIGAATQPAMSQNYKETPKLPRTDFPMKSKPYYTRAG